MRTLERFFTCLVGMIQATLLMQCVGNVGSDGSNRNCSAGYCLNGGTCIEAQTSITCQCPAGYTGTQCETNINECDPNPCQNGGTCEDGVAEYQCHCLFGFNGTNCENIINQDNSFVFGVWLQGPEQVYNGKTIAQNYKDIGINTFIGLWAWPSESGMYSGYALASMQALKNATMNVYAGSDAAAVNWINAHPEFWDIFKGYMLGDEPDMNRNSGIQSVADANTPTAWKTRGDALRALDNTIPSVRAVYANFGKPFSKDEWYGNEHGQTGSKASDFSMYTEPVDVLSSDYYGITDPWETPSNHGIWTYGRAVRNTIYWANYQTNIDGITRPVWGFVETSAPWTDASSSNWMYQRMQASLLMPIVWNMVISGAQGIIYFMHDFSPTPLGNDYAGLKEPGMPDAMKAANQSVLAYGAVLLTPDISGTSVVTTGPVNVIALTKHFEGATYIFAMGDGNSSYRNGLAVDATITVRGQTGTKNVEVLNDSRTVTMTDGTFNDHFEPYEVHIYKLN
jgi:hypothetical protein